MGIQDQPDYKRLYEAERADRIRIQSERDRLREEIEAATAHMRKTTRQLGNLMHFLRVKCGCPLCYQIGEHTADCPSRK